ncbi:MAG TPA: hypothetical protein DCZ75_14140 [Geobacter sp.]|nr:hypothetical protein [Geobacter sp.]
MTRRLTWTILIISLFLCQCLVASADEPEKVEKVVVTGVGVDANRARQNAIRNAVEQVIGTYVSSETMVKDSALIKDEILTYSGGYVKESRVVSTEESDGLMSVKLEALVVSTLVKQKIQNLNIAMKKVDGGSLFGTASSKIDEIKNASDFLAKVLKKYPQSAYVIQVEKPEIVSTDPISKKAEVAVPMTLSFDKTFVTELKTTLNKIAIKHYSNVPKSTFDKYQGYPKEEANFNLLCFSKKNNMLNSMFEQCEAINSSVYTSIREQFRYEGYNYASLLELEMNSRRPAFTVSFNNSNGEALFLTTFKLASDENCLSQGFHGDNGPYPLCWHGFLPNIFWEYSTFGSTSYTHSALLTDGILKFVKKFNVDVEALPQITSITVSIAPWD